MRREEDGLECEVLGPLGMEAPLGDWRLLGHSLLPIAWARHPGTLALDVKIGESR